MSPSPPRIADVRLEPYALAFRRPWRTSRGAALTRTGWLLRLRDDRGGEAVGESAPWPDAGTETAPACAAALAGLVDDLAGRTAADALAALPEQPATPAARCGVEAALLGLEARATGRPVRRLLADDAAESIAVNAACGAADEALPRAVAAAVAAGFGVVKIKLGVAPWPEELDRLRALSLPPACGLRLDANGAWSAAQAGNRLAELTGLPVECVEEPLARYDRAALSRLQEASPFPLALDESLNGRVAELLASPCPVRRLVLKPMVLGGARATVRLARRAAARGVETVVTTTLEAAPGRWLVAAVAAATRSPLAHGLDTGGWLAQDVGTGPRVEHGRIRFDGG